MECDLQELNSLDSRAALETLIYKEEEDIVTQKLPIAELGYNVAIMTDGFI